MGTWRTLVGRPLCTFCPMRGFSHNPLIIRRIGMDELPVQEDD
jgi:hypothetical protein